MSTGPLPGLAAEGDSDQLPPEDTLLDQVDPLDEGYSPPEQFHLSSLTPSTLDERLDQEELEVWDWEAPAPDLTRSEHFSPAAPFLDGEESSSLYASAQGVSGGGASAEEAAMHEVGEDPD